MTGQRGSAQGVVVVKFHGAYFQLAVAFKLGLVLGMLNQGQSSGVLTVFRVISRVTTEIACITDRQLTLWWLDLQEGRLPSCYF